MSLRTVALLGLSSLAIAAQAQSQFRLFSEVQASYYNGILTTSPVFGLGPSGSPNTIYGQIDYGRDANSAAAYQSSTPIPIVTAGGTWAGDTSQGMPTVTASAFSKTDWGSNHASASISGFSRVSQDYDGQFVVGGVTWPMHVQSSTVAMAQGQSTWEELYQIGGGTGVGQFTGTIHIDGTLKGTTGNGSASMEWALTTFSNQLVASLTAVYDAGTNQWDVGVFSGGQWTFTQGTGTLNINQDVIGSYAFTYGQALYLRSDLYSSVNGNGTSDFSNTVQFTGMKLPQDSTVFVRSGAAAADYGINFAGNGSGTICQDLACATGGGLPIPEPETYALLLSGLGVIAWVARRRRGR